GLHGFHFTRDNVRVKINQIIAGPLVQTFFVSAVLVIQGENDAAGEKRRRKEDRKKAAKHGGREKAQGPATEGRHATISLTIEIDSVLRRCPSRRRAEALKNLLGARLPVWDSHDIRYGLAPNGTKKDDITHEEAASCFRHHAIPLNRVRRA